jgi:hypothetical protein
VTGVRAGIDVVAADAKFLRAKAEEYAVDAKNILTQDVQELESLVQHRGTLVRGCIGSPCGVRLPVGYSVQ